MRFWRPAASQNWHLELAWSRQSIHRSETFHFAVGRIAKNLIVIRTEISKRYGVAAGTYNGHKNDEKQKR